MSRETLSAGDGHQIAIHHWPARSRARGVLVWLHGMADHGARYAPLAEVLSEAGWHVLAPDHRGHGASVAAEELRGHFADQHGWDTVLADVGVVLAHVQGRYPSLPVVLGGHSMGSFITLAFCERHASALQTPLAGVILCGSDYKQPWLWRLLTLPVRLAHWRNGPRGTSRLIKALTFDAFAKKIAHRRTDFDWLSRVQAEVDKYINDPWCGHDCTTQLWLDLMRGLREAHAPRQLRRLPANLPLLLVGGDSDPMSGNGKGMPALYKALHRAGCGPLTFAEFAGGRHEILNDLCRDEVIEDIGDWLLALKREESTRAAA